MAKRLVLYILAALLLTQQAAFAQYFTYPVVPGVADITEGGTNNNALDVSNGNLMMGNGTKIIGFVPSATIGAPLLSAGPGNPLTYAPEAFIANGNLSLGSNAADTGNIVLYGSTSGYCLLTVPSICGNTTITFPSNMGSAGNQLFTDGVGNTYWGSPGGVVLSIAGGGTNNGGLSVAQGAIPYGDGSKLIGLAPPSGNGYIMGWDNVNNKPYWYYSTVSGTVNYALSSQLAYYPNNGSAVSGSQYTSLSAGVLTLGNASTEGRLQLQNGFGSTVEISAFGGVSPVKLPLTAGVNGNILTTDGAGQMQYVANNTLLYSTLSLGAAPTHGQVWLYGITSGFVQIQPADVTAANTYFKLPGSNGTTTNQFLFGDGYGAIDYTPYARIVNGQILLGTSGTAGSVVLNGSSSGTCTISVPAAAGTGTIFTLPATNGSANQLLYGNGSGVLGYTSGVAASAGALTLGSSGVAGSVVLNGSSSGTCTISVPAAAGTGTVFTLPANNGSSGQYIQTNGSGVLSYQTVNSTIGIQRTCPTTGTIHGEYWTSSNWSQTGNIVVQGWSILHFNGTATFGGSGSYTVTGTGFTGGITSPTTRSACLGSSGAGPGGGNGGPGAGGAGGGASYCANGGWGGGNSVSACGAGGMAVYAGYLAGGPMTMGNGGGAGSAYSTFTGGAGGAGGASLWVDAVGAVTVNFAAASGFPGAAGTTGGGTQAGSGGGGGGGSMAFVSSASVTVTNGANISLNGGAGSNAQTTGGAGGAGAGGYFFARSPSTSVTGTPTVAAGSNGTGGSTAPLSGGAGTVDTASTAWQ